MVAAHIGRLDGWVGEVKVGMFPFVEHRRISKQIAGESQCHRQFTATFRSAKHQSMGDAVLLNHLHQTVPYFLLTYHILF